MNKINEELEEITTSSDFFEKEKQRQKEKRDQEKAQNIREALAMEEAVSNRDLNWLKRYDEALSAGAAPPAEETENVELQEAIAQFDAETEAEEAEALSEELPFLGEAEDIDEEDAKV